MIANNAGPLNGKGRVDATLYTAQPSRFIFKSRNGVKPRTTSKVQACRTRFGTIAKYYGSTLSSSLKNTWRFKAANDSYLQQRQKWTIEPPGINYYMAAVLLGDVFSTSTNLNLDASIADITAHFENFAGNYTGGQIQFVNAFAPPPPTGDDVAYLYTTSPGWRVPPWQRWKLLPNSVTYPVWSNPGDNLDIVFTDVFASQRQSGDIIAVAVYSTFSGFGTGCNFFGYVTVP